MPWNQHMSSAFWLLTALKEASSGQWPKQCWRNRYSFCWTKRCTTTLHEVKHKHVLSQRILTVKKKKKYYNTIQEFQRCPKLTFWTPPEGWCERGSGQTERRTAAQASGCWRTRADVSPGDAPPAHAPLLEWRAPETKTSHTAPHSVYFSSCLDSDAASDNASHSNKQPIPPEARKTFYGAPMSHVIGLQVNKMF